VITYQTLLSTQGFTADEVAAYQSIGLTTEEIDGHRQSYIQADPT
jgi:hypothetical protein